MQPNQIENITVFTDASFCPDTKAAGGAYWARSTDLRTSSSFKLRGVEQSREAELITACTAVLNLAKDFEFGPLLKKGPHIRVILVIDCLFIKHVLEENVSARLSDAARKIVLQVRQLQQRLGFLLKINHVKAHTKGKAPRQWVNDWCDKNAKRHMVLLRKEIREHRGPVDTKLSVSIKPPVASIPVPAQVAASKQVASKPPVQQVAKKPVAPQAAAKGSSVKGQPAPKQKQKGPPAPVANGKKPSGPPQQHQKKKQASSPSVKKPSQGIQPSQPKKKQEHPKPLVKGPIAVAKPPQPEQPVLMPPPWDTTPASPPWDITPTNACFKEAPTSPPWDITPAILPYKTVPRLVATQGVQASLF